MTDRRPIIAANWKMYKTHLEAIQAVQKLSYLLDTADTEKTEVVIVPPFTALRSVQTLLESDKIPYGLGAQNMHPDEQGAFTGEVSPLMLVALKVGYVIVGHSERRTLFGETDTTVNRKAVAAFAAGLTPIVCIGETLDQRERNETFDVLDRQIKVGLDGLTREQMGLLVLAYEPVWAIGTGRNATPAQAAEAHGHIRQRLRQWFGAEAADQCHVIYGGSVKPDNIRDLVKQPDVDGALVGGASLDVRGFFEIVTRSRPAAV